jgi:hypothetical protein
MMPVAIVTSSNEKPTADQLNLNLAKAVHRHRPAVKRAIFNFLCNFLSRLRADAETLKFE